MRRLPAILLAVYLGFWVHEIAHTVQGYALDSVLVAPYVFPFTALNDCWLGDGIGHHTSIPGIGCTDAFQSYDVASRSMVEGMAYAIEAVATVTFAFILSSIRVTRPLPRIVPEV